METPRSRSDIGAIICFRVPAADPPTSSAARSVVWTPPAPIALGAILPGYEVLSLLGRGGMGAVYYAVQKALDRPVALKLLPAELGADAKFAERFTREARAMAKLNHPHIVSVYDFGATSEGHLFFSMEFVEGTTLAALIHGPGVDARRALAISSQVCLALAYAHENGVVHRDMKPANVLVDAAGSAKVADFGLARVVDTSEAVPGHTLTGVVMGTPDYMAPEQKRGMAVDHRADIYSLGVILYEMLCRETPQGAFSPPSKKAGCDAGLDRIVEKAMQPAPEQRYQSSAEMKADVDAAAGVLRMKVRAAPARRMVLLLIAAAALAAWGVAFWRRDRADSTERADVSLQPAALPPMPASAKPGENQPGENQPANPYDSVVEAMPAIVVTTPVDKLESGGGRSLREALRDAKPGMRVTFSPDIFNGESQDVIVLNPALGVLEFKTYAVVDAEPNSGGVTLDAKGAMPTIFRNEERAGLILRRLTLRNCGGGSGERAAAVENNGTATLTDCTLENNHGSAGALVNSGTLTLQRCTFAGNSSQRKGGGLLVSGRGARLKASNCTFTGNTATNGGAVNVSNFARDGEVTFLHCTIVGNKAIKGTGGGIQAYSTTVLTNCIVAGNTAVTAGAENASGEITQGGANLLNGDPRLGPLADNGGYTPTMALLPGSPARDSATKVRGTQADQRGKPRRSGFAADLGAFEAQE